MRKADTLTTFMCEIVLKSGSLRLLETSRIIQASNEVVFLKQTMFLGNIVLQLFRVYSLYACNVVSYVKFVLCFYICLLLLLLSSSSSSPLCRVFILTFPHTNCVPTQYSVAAILLLLFTVHIPSVSVFNLLYLYISTFRSVCAVPNMAVFCSSFTSCFPRYVAHFIYNQITGTN